MMILNFLLPGVWGLVLIASFVGYGALLRRLLFPREEVGWANEAAWGMAFVLLLGGALSYAYALSRPLILGLAATGCALSLADAFRIRGCIADRLSAVRGYMHEHPYAFALKMLGYGVIIALAGIHYLNAIAAAGRYQGDDVKGYFIFADQLLQLGGFAPDWFNGYRLNTGLGGQALLNAFQLALFDYKNLALIDGGVALVICIGLVLRIANERRLSYPWKWTLAMFFLNVPLYPALRFNSSSLTTGMVMFLALFAFLNRDSLRDDTPVRNALIIGLLAAGACVLKTNLIPPCVVILFLSYLWYAISVRFKKEAVVETLLVPAFVILMLLPWMLSQLRSSGTLLYPILGMGFDESAYGNYLTEDFAGGLTLASKVSGIFRVFFMRDIYLALLVVGAVLFAVAGLRRRAAAHAFALGSLVAVVIILLKSDISNTWPFFRYLFVCVFITLIVLLATLMEEVSRRVALKKPATLGQYCSAAIGDRMAAIALATLLGMGGAFFGYYQFAEPSKAPFVGCAPEMYSKFLATISSEMAKQGGMFPESEYARYKKAQESVPAGEAILSRDEKTILYDDGRNPIYDINDPGSCSPPPGMPYFQGPEAVAAYLLSYHIRYVAYAYSDQAGYPIIDNLWRLKPDRPYGHRVSERAKVALDRVLGQLGASRKRIYDDGELFIIDLKSPAAVAMEYREPNYFQIGKILTPAWATTQGFDRNKVWTDGHGVIGDIRYQLQPGDDMLVLNTFGYHPWKGDVRKLQLAVSVNGVPLPGLAKNEKSYCFSLEQIRQPITRITIDSATFVPRNEGVRFGKADDRQTLGIDVDTIEIANKEEYFRSHKTE